MPFLTVHHNIFYRKSNQNLHTLEQPSVWQGDSGSSIANIIAVSEKVEVISRCNNPANCATYRKVFHDKVGQLLHHFSITSFKFIPQPQTTFCASTICENLGVSETMFLVTSNLIGLLFLGHLYGIYCYERASL